jgi:hypothetical protein
MRKSVSVVLTILMAGGVQAGALAAGAQSATGGLQGVAKSTTQQNLAGVRVQVRAPNGQLAATGTTDATGSFAFTGLAPGNYTIEVLDAAGHIVGTSASVAVASGMTATVTVTAAAAGAIAAATGGGVGLFGLGTIATVAVVGGAAAATIGAVVATRNNKITICHKPANSTPTTIEIDQNAQDSHFGHGDTPGACPASPSK